MARALVSLASALAVLAVAPVSAAPLAQTPAEAVARLYLGVFDRGDAAACSAFMREHWPLSHQGAGDCLAMRDQSGGFDLVKIERATETTFRAVLRPRLADSYVELNLRVAQSAPSTIQDLSLTAIARPDDIPAPTRVSMAALQAAIHDRIDAMGDFSGVVLIAQNGRPIFSYATGLADRQRNIPNTPDTRFRIASMGKMFTAVAIGQLLEAGRLRLDAHVGDYLKDYPNAEFASTVTIAELLDHTAGAGDFMGPKFDAAADRLNTVSDYVATFGSRAPSFRPGSRFEYSNYGYIVLGRIVEVVAGESYDAYLRDHIFAPSRMTDTGLANAPNIALGYVKTPDGYVPNASIMRGSATPAGGAYSTAHDLLAFANALSQHRLLSAADTELFITSKVAAGPQAGVGYGFGFERFGDGPIDVGHTGGAPGSSCSVHIVGGGKATIIVLTNDAPTWRGDKLADFIAQRIAVD
jgi:D-alanyl-D-alanine carboxypeptidase